MLFKQPEMLADTFNECPDHPEPCQLNLCIWLTLNDVGRSYFTQDCMYLTRMLARIHVATEAFSKVSKRKVKLAFLPYFHAPVIWQNGPQPEHTGRNAARNVGKAQDTLSYAKATGKSNGTQTPQERQLSKFSRPATRERTLSVKKVKLKHQATKKAIEDMMFHVPDDIQGDKRWESLLNKPGHQAAAAKETEEEQDQGHQDNGQQEEKTDH